MIVNPVLCLIVARSVAVSPLQINPNYLPNSFLPAMSGSASAPVSFDVVRFNPVAGTSAPSGKSFSYTITQTDKDQYYVNGSNPMQFVEVPNFDPGCTAFMLGYPVGTAVKRGTDADGKTTWDIQGVGKVIPNQQGNTPVVTYYNQYTLIDLTTVLTIKDAQLSVTQTITQNASVPSQ